MTHPLRIEGLAHHYGATPVLQPIGLTIEPGEVVALLGPSGCGKTTILRAIAGLVQPSAGSVWVGGKQVLRQGTELVPPAKRGVGLVFQDYALFPALTALENIAYGTGDLKGAQALLTEVGLADRADAYPSQLSGGQQQRVALARALATKPHLLLLDEPFANVDAARRTQLGHRLRDQLQRAGRAALLVTHDHNDALALADKICVMVPGPSGASIGQFASAADVYLHPKTMACAQTTGLCSALTGEAAAVLGLGAGPHFVRPHQLQLVPDNKGPGRVVRSSFCGSHYLTQVTLCGQELWADHTERLRPDTPVRISIQHTSADEQTSLTPD